jgi:hypothetical protein
MAALTPNCNRYAHPLALPSWRTTLQASKRDEGQASIASALPPADPSKVYDVAVVGAGPAGMFLASELARRGVSTVVIGELNRMHAPSSLAAPPMHVPDAAHGRACLGIRGSP